MSKLVGIFIMILVAGPLGYQAQAQHRYHSWFRVSLGYQLSPKWQLDTEVQNRRQQDAGHHNPIALPLLFSYRNWVHFKASSWLKLSAAPLAYFSNYSLVQNKGDVGKPPVRELRHAFSALVQPRSSPILGLRYRSGLEYRRFNNGQSAIWRTRNQLGIQYHINEHSTLMIFDEIFYTVKGQPRPFTYDHNRIGISFSYRFHPSFSFDLGYIHIQRHQRAQSIAEENILVYFSYQIPSLSAKAK